MIEINIKQSLGISGRVVLMNGRKKVSDKKNTITNHGLCSVVWALMDNCMPFNKIAVGDYSGPDFTPAEVALQSELQDEIERNEDFVETDIRVSPENPNVHQMVITGDFGGAVNPSLSGENVTEIGLFDKSRPNSGTMFARQKPDASYFFDVAAKLRVQWFLNLAVSSKLADSGGVVAIGMKLLCEALKRKDNRYLLSEGYPWGINTISLGTNDVVTNDTMLELVDLEPDYDAPPSITNIDFTGYDADKNFGAKLIIQRYIAEGEVPVEIKEVGLFNDHRQTPSDNLAPPEDSRSRTMFSRVALDEPIPAGQEATLTWEILITRQETL